MRTCRSEYFLDPFLRKEDTLLPSNPSPFRAVSTYAICPWTKQESTTTYTCQNPFLALVSAFYFNQDSCQSWWWFLGRTDRGSMVLSCNCFVSFGLRIERKVTLWRRGKLTLQNLRPINNLASNFQDHGCSQCQGKSGSLNVSSIWLVESLEKGVLLLFNESVISAVNHLMCFRQNVCKNVWFYWESTKPAPQNDKWLLLFKDSAVVGVVEGAKCQGNFSSKVIFLSFQLVSENRSDAMCRNAPKERNPKEDRCSPPILPCGVFFKKCFCCALVGYW